MICAIKKVEPRDRSYEVYGYEMIIDENLHVWLTKVDQRPDLTSGGGQNKSSFISKFWKDLTGLFHSAEWSSIEKIKAEKCGSLKKLDLDSGMKELKPMLSMRLSMSVMSSELANEEQKNDFAQR